MNHSPLKNSRTGHAEDVENSADLEARQVELEAEMLAIGSKACKKQLDILSEADSGAGHKLIREAVPALAEAIRNK